MTSAWKEPPGRDERAEDQDVARDENQLDLFEAVLRPSTDAILSSEADVTYGGVLHEGDEGPAEMMTAPFTPAAAHSPTMSGTVAAGVAMTARSTFSGTSAMRG